MEEKLITLAIHTYEKAQILKTLLETEGIDVCIHNVNLIQPVVSAGVRVRIKESDLPHALRIIEDSNWLKESDGDEDEKKEKKNERKKILIPVDFSDYSIKACEIGINYAAKVRGEVMIMHAYFAPYFPSAVPIGDSLVYQVNEEESVSHILKRVQADVDNLCNYINRKIDSGELPKVKYDYILREGLPEEEIVAYCKEYKPALTVMGTKGKNRKEMDLIGSVTGEVFEANRTPVLAIPENTPFKNLKDIKNIAFATSFNQRDPVIFDKFMELISGFDFNIHIFNISTSKDEWNEIRLTGINEYFKKQYPAANITHTVLADGDLLLAVEKFVRDEHIDVIAIGTQRRNIIARMFNPGIARKMFFHTDTPLLVMHS
ncbi:MAG: universal stress protein [Tannerellaceae bacterium]|jgi:nucleotide-binding universal stress UspA family protein|nr:universal stress protein [Tannerellaceae bacterium]